LKQTMKETRYCVQTLRVQRAVFKSCIERLHQFGIMITYIKLYNKR
jgi:hypothetical protein